jgi:RNA polymerase sigma factor (sigma-70 family)
MPATDGRLPMTVDLMPFSELLQQARAGDQTALAHLSQTYEKDVRIAARVLLGPALRTHLDSVDLVQTVHKSLLLGVQNDKFNINSPAQLIALAMTLVRRKVARKWRKHRRQLHLDQPRNAGDDVASVLSTLRSSEADPARAAQLHEAEARLLRELDPGERQLLQLRLQGYTTAEAARELQLNPDVLRVHLSRLRKRLQELGILSEWL